MSKEEAREVTKQADVLMAKVILERDYQKGFVWDDKPEHVEYEAAGKYAADPDGGVYEIPGETLARWNSARDAYLTAQEDVEALMLARQDELDDRRGI